MNRRSLLSLSIAGITAGLFGTSARAETPILSAPDAYQLNQAGVLVLLDIRSREEWEDTGVPTGAWPVSMHEPDFAQKLQAILDAYPPDKIGLICATGGRTNHVASILQRNGITGVIDVSEGMFGNPRGPGWTARGLPISTLDDALEAYENSELGQ